MIRKAAMLCVAMLLGVAFAVPFLKRQNPVDPIHRGKAVSSWLVELTSSDYRVREEAEDALRAVGAEAIPQLIRGLQKKDFPLRKATAAVTRRIPFLRIDLADSVLMRENAARMLGELGPRASSAIPDLIRALKDQDI